MLRPLSRAPRSQTRQPTPKPRSNRAFGLRDSRRQKQIRHRHSLEALQSKLTDDVTGLAAPVFRSDKQPLVSAGSHHALQERRDFLRRRVLFVQDGGKFFRVLAGLLVVLEKLLHRIDLGEVRQDPLLLRGVVPVVSQEAEDVLLVLHLGDPYAGSGQTLRGSFSAVSKPNFASEYSLELGSV